MVTCLKIVAFRVLLRGEIAQIQVHLPDVVVLHRYDLKVHQHKTAQDPVVENQIHAPRGVIDGHPVLTPRKVESLARSSKGKDWR